VFFSVDGNFGLCRKKSSGTSVRPPLHGQTMFFEQDEVDKYVESYGTIKVSLNKVCVRAVAKKKMSRGGGQTQAD